MSIVQRSSSFIGHPGKSQVGPAVLSAPVNTSEMLDTPLTVYFHLGSSLASAGKWTLIGDFKYT